jgi:hypothetical protein
MQAHRLGKSSHETVIEKKQLRFNRYTVRKRRQTIYFSGWSYPESRRIQMFRYRTGLLL